MMRSFSRGVRLIGVALWLRPPAAWAQSGKGDWAADWEKVLQAARKEGKVVVSVPASAELRRKTEEAFGKRFPNIDLELVAGRGSSNIKKIIAEKKAGVHYFDVHVGGTNSIITGLLAEGLLDSVAPLMLLPEVRDPNQGWGGHIWADKARRHIYMFQAYIP